jgi:DNA-binding response OmpR family regulator
MAEQGYHMIRQERSAGTPPEPTRAKEEQQAIVLYSPDMDYCMSLRLLFQDRYTMITTTDANMLVTIVNAFGPDLVIIDALPTQRMRQRVELMMRVMFFTTQRIADHEIHEFLQTSVDAVFSKPVDLAEITERIRALVEHEIA